MQLFITFILGLFLLVGVFVVKLPIDQHKVELVSCSVAFGTMLILAFAELLPESLEHFTGAEVILLPIGIVCGVGLLKMLDRFVPEHDHSKDHHHHCTDENAIHIGVISSLAVILHNLVEGMALYNVLGTSLVTGSAMAFGVGLHNIPMGMVIASTLRSQKKSKRILLLGLTSISTFLGGLLMRYLSTLLTPLFIGFLISLALGMILYILIFELTPHILHAEDKKLCGIGIVIGIILMILCLYLG